MEKSGVGSELDLKLKESGGKSETGSHFIHLGK